MHSDSVLQLLNLPGLNIVKANCNSSKLKKQTNYD
jgi:hypothetical protein